MYKIKGEEEERERERERWMEKKHRIKRIRRERERNKRKMSLWMKAEVWCRRRKRKKKVLRKGIKKERGLRVEVWSVETIQITQFDRCVYLCLNGRFSAWKWKLLQWWEIYACGACVCLCVCRFLLNKTECILEATKPTSYWSHFFQNVEKKKIIWVFISTIGNHFYHISPHQIREKY